MTQIVNKIRKRKSYSLFTIKAWQQTFNLVKSFGYINSGWWETPKFFVNELCVLYDIFIWFIFLGPSFERSYFGHSLLNPRTSSLYLIVDLHEYNELIGKQIDWTKNFTMDIDFILQKPWVIYLDLKLPIGQDLLTLEDEWLEQQKLQDEQEILELEEFWWLHPWSKKIPPKKQRLVFDLKSNYETLFPYDAEHNSWFYASFFSIPNLVFANTYICTFIPILFDNFLEWINLIHVIWSYIYRWIWASVRAMLFMQIICYFPIQFYFLIFLRLKLKNIYFKLTNFLYKPTFQDLNTKIFSLPNPLSLLELPPFFFEPWFINYKLPWIDFSIIQIFLIKPIPLRSLFHKFFLLPTYYLPLPIFTDKNCIERLAKPLVHTGLTWLYWVEYFLLSNKNAIQINYLEFFFANFVYWHWHSGLSTNFYYNLPPDIYIILPFLNKINLLLFLIWKNRYRFYKNFNFSFWTAFISNDSIFFWPFFRDFDTSNVTTFSPKKLRGRPRKDRPFFFESESSEFWGIDCTNFVSQKIDTFWMLLPYSYYKQPDSFNFFVYMLLRLFILFLIKPF